MTRAALVLDVRDRAAFERGHAAGAAHLPADAFETRAFELPPREDTFDVVAADEPAAHAAVARLHARGSTGARVAPPGIAADRSETGPPRRFPWRPPEWFDRCADAAALPAGVRALDVACGSGRVVAAMALRGYRAAGLDHLPDALERGRALARAAGVGASFLRADATRPLPIRPASLALVTGFRYLDRELFGALVALLSPGGELWWETFGTAQARHGHPKRPAYLLAPGELESLCRRAGLAVYDSRETDPPGGPALSSVRARRPA